MADFIPSSDDELSVWTINFAGKLATHAALLDISSADVNNIAALAEQVRNAIAAADAARAAAKKAVAEKNDIVNNSTAGFRRLIKFIKAHRSYTAGIGHDLDIIASDTAVDKIAFQSVLTAETHPGYVILHFTKKGVEGVNVYTRLKGESKWVKLSYDSHSPYTDNRSTADGRPENREYMCIGVVNDEEVGQQSDIVSVAFGG